MEIDANIKWPAVSNSLPATKPTAAGPEPDAASDSFASSSALEAALQNTPDLRPEAVSNGLTLAADSGYPSGETIKQLSDFLAARLQNGLE